jgi:hypothetical protein
MQALQNSFDARWPLLNPIVFNDDKILLCHPSKFHCAMFVWDKIVFLLVTVYAASASFSNVDLKRQLLYRKPRKKKLRRHLLWIPKIVIAIRLSFSRSQICSLLKMSTSDPRYQLGILRCQWIREQVCLSGVFPATWAEDSRKFWNFINTIWGSKKSLPFKKTLEFADFVFCPHKSTNLPHD